MAHDASITESVMLGHYVDETDEERWMKSNRTFERIVVSLPAEMAQRDGYLPVQARTGIAGVLQSAIARRDREAVKLVLTRIGNNDPRHP